MYALGPVQAIAGLFGPAVFLVVWLVTPHYAALGVMVWLAAYWAVGVVPIIYTALIPVVGFALMGVPLDKIAWSFAHPALLLIVGPTVAIVSAVHCGLVERLAVFFVDRIGSSVRAHTVFWLVFATCLSNFAADVVVALALIPIVMKVLARAGFDTVERVAKSRSAMLLIIATSIGAGLGGILTPMAGGQAAITWIGLNKALGGEVTALSFTLRMLIPSVLCLVTVAGVFAVLAPGQERFEFLGTGALGPMTRHEKVVVVVLAAGVLLPYFRPWLPINLPMLYACFVAVLVVLRVPGVGAVLPLHALKLFPLSTISVWPIAMSVSTLVGVTGTGERVMGLIGDFWLLDPWLAVGGWTAFVLTLAQIASDTGTAGMLVPILNGVLPAADINPVPWIMLTGFAVNLSFMVPTATGTIGVLYALGGRGHVLLPLYGFLCAVCCGVVSWLFWGAVIANNWGFWFTLDVLE